VTNEAWFFGTDRRSRWKKDEEKNQKDFTRSLYDPSVLSHMQSTGHGILRRPPRLTVYRSWRRHISIKRPAIVLGLESSADDTCAAVLSIDKNGHVSLCFFSSKGPESLTVLKQSQRESAIRSNIVLSQRDLHIKWGGIHPYHSAAR
jgi:hypothetical protein